MHVFLITSRNATLQTLLRMEGFYFEHIPSTTLVRVEAPKGTKRLFSVETFGKIEAVYITPNGKKVRVDVGGGKLGCDRITLDMPKTSKQAHA